MRGPSHIPLAPSGPPIHGLRTDRGTHYNRLLEQDNLEIEEEDDSEAEEEYYFGVEETDSEGEEEDDSEVEVELDFKPAQVFYVKTSGGDYSFFDLEPEEVGGLTAIKRSVDELSGPPQVPGVDLSARAATKEENTSSRDPGAVPLPSAPSSSPSEPGAAVSSEEAPDLKVAFVISPALLEVLLRIIKKFNMASDADKIEVVNFLETIESKSIRIVSQESGKEHNLSIESNELKHVERTVTKEELTKISETFRKEHPFRSVNTNKVKINPTLWSEDAMKGFEDFYLKEFESRATDPKLGAMNETNFENHCIKKYVREMKAIGNREQFLVRGDNSLDAKAQKARIQESLKKSRPAPKAGAGGHPMPELEEHLACEIGSRKVNPKQSSPWKFYSDARKSKVVDYLIREYELITTRGVRPTVYSDQQIIKDYLRYCLETDHHVESIPVPGDVERRELRFSVEKGKLKFSEKLINLIEETVEILERHGPGGHEDFLREFEPTSETHRRYARATMKAKGLNELIVEAKGSQLWILREDSATGFTSKLEECRLPQVTTTRSKPQIFRFDELQAYYRHCLEKFKLRNSDSGRWDRTAFEKQCLAEFELEYRAPRNPELFPELKAGSSSGEAAGSATSASADRSPLDTSDVWDAAKSERFVESRDKKIALRKSGDPKLVAMDKETFKKYCREAFEVEERVF